MGKSLYSNAGYSRQTFCASSIVAARAKITGGTRRILELSIALRLGALILNYLCVFAPLRETGFLTAAGELRLDAKRRHSLAKAQRRKDNSKSKTPLLG